MKTVSARHPPAELIRARRRGFLIVKGYASTTDLVNQWWRECRRSRQPYVVITVRGSKTADLRLENATMDAPYPAPVSRFNAEVQSKLHALLEPALARSGLGFVNRDACEAFGVRPEGVEILAVRMLAVVAGKCRCVDRAPSLVEEAW